MLVTFNKTQLLVQILYEVVYASFFRYVFARFLEIFHNHPDPFDCEYLFNLNLWNLIITKVLALLLSTCPIVFDFWELSHVIFLKLRKKQLLAKLSKFTQNGPRLSFWVKMVLILWICTALQGVLSFSAWEKSRDSTGNSQKLEDM